jgi:hypothetical protein
MAKKTIVDFTNTDSNSGRVRIPEGDYKARVGTVKHETSKAGNPMLVWEFEITDGKFKGKKLIDRTVLQDNSLWKLKQLLEAMGIQVPNKRVALDLARYPGMGLGITVVDDPYEGRVSSKVSDYVNIAVLDEDEDEEEDDDEDEDEEEPPRRKKGKKGKKAKAKAVEDEEEIEDLDLDEI